MPRCIILTPLYAGEELPWIAPQPGDFLICADGGWARARQFGLTPQLVVGDFDSMPLAMCPDVPTLTLPTEKDDTDLVVCLHEGRKRGYTEFILAGAIGGRFDHTLSCLQCAADCALRGERAWLVDGQNRDESCAGHASFAENAGAKAVAAGVFAGGAGCDADGRKVDAHPRDADVPLSAGVQQRVCGGHGGGHLPRRAADGVFQCG